MQRGRESETSSLRSLDPLAEARRRSELRKPTRALTEEQVEVLKRVLLPVEGALFALMARLELEAPLEVRVAVLALAAQVVREGLEDRAGLAPLHAPLAKRTDPPEGHSSDGSAPAASQSGEQVLEVC